MSSNAKVTIRLDADERMAFLCLARINGKTMQSVLAASARRFTKRAMKKLENRQQAEKI